MNLTVYYDDGSAVELVPKPKVPLYWVPHDLFRYSYDNPKDRRYNPNGDGKVRGWSSSTPAIPEVYNLDSPDLTLPTSFYEIVVGINPQLGRSKALTLLGLGLAFCNHQYGRLDPPRLMGGAVVTGTVVGDKLLLKSINTTEPRPNPIDVLNDPTLWFWCVSVNHKGGISLFQRRGEDGLMHPCRFPVFGNGIYINLNELLRLPDNFIPDPFWMPK